jgi:tetratricopeptide (TPR) repeat protein
MLRRTWTIACCAALLAAAQPAELLRARDAQDRAALDRLAAEAEAKAQASPNDDKAHYQAALAGFHRAEVALELRDRGAAARSAEAGIRAAERAVALKPGVAEYHRLLGSLCGQVIPANLMAGLRFGRCAMEEVSKAVELDPKDDEVWLSRGVGNFYLPAGFGGGLDKAVQDFEKAIQLNPKNAEAHLWLGVTLRRLNRNSEAHKALAKSLALNPARVWTKQQLEKTPAQ